MNDLLDTAPCGFLSFADDGIIHTVNITLLNWLGYTLTALLGQHISVLLSVSGRIFYQTHFFPLLKLHGQAEEIYFSLRSHDGQQLPVLANALRNQRADVMMNDCVFIPMHQRNKYEEALLQAKKATETALQAMAAANAELERTRLTLEHKQAELISLNVQLHMLSTIDVLTGLKNRRVFNERISAEVLMALRYQTNLSLLLLDIDHFKRVNDRFGHAEGDRVLQSVACILQHEARETDIVTRYGGEEFAIVLPHTNSSAAIALAERLRQTIERETSVTISQGLATLCPDTNNECNLILAADQALYASKQHGRNCVTHADRLEIENAPVLQHYSGG